MPSVIIYLDGSSVPLNANQNRRASLGWGLVVLANDSQVELHGAHSADQQLTGFHEQVALIEAVRYAHQQGFAPEDIAFYTDDEITCNAQEGMHPGNCRAAWTHQLKGRIQQLARRLYDEDVWELVRAYLQGARVVKLKSHRNLVYNHRVDYLAKNAAYSLKASPREVVPYDDWLTAGFLRYLDNDTTTTWFAPFTGQPLLTH